MPPQGGEQVIMNYKKYWTTQRRNEMGGYGIRPCKRVPQKSVQLGGAYEQNKTCELRRLHKIY